MVNVSEKKPTVSAGSAYATIKTGDRPAKSKLVLLYRKLQRQGVSELQDDYKPHENNKIATRPENAINDDFICFLKADGSSITSSGGVTVIGKKLK